MVDSAFAWAAKNNLLRTSEVHGEQEAKLLLEEGFCFDEVEGERTEQRLSLEMEDPPWSVMHSTMHALILIGLLMIIIYTCMI